MMLWRFKNMDSMTEEKVLKQERMIETKGCEVFAKILQPFCHLFRSFSVQKWYSENCYIVSVKELL